MQAFYATGPLSYASEAYAYQNIRSLAGFGNAEFKFTDAITMIGGVRYTITDRDFHGCTKDPGQDQSTPFWNAIFGLHLGPGDCSVLTPFYPNAPRVYTNTGPDALRGTLNENNVSWNIGTDFRRQRTKPCSIIESRRVSRREASRIDKRRAEVNTIR